MRPESLSESRSCSALRRQRGAGGSIRRGWRRRNQTSHAITTRMGRSYGGDGAIALSLLSRMTPVFSSPWPHLPGPRAVLIAQLGVWRRGSPFDLELSFLPVSAALLRAQRVQGRAMRGAEGSGAPCVPCASEHGAILARSGRKRAAFIGSASACGGAVSERGALRAAGACDTSLLP